MIPFIYFHQNNILQQTEGKSMGIQLSFTKPNLKRFVKVKTCHSYYSMIFEKEIVFHIRQISVNIEVCFYL